MEKISIILCTYNGEKYVDEQISSIVHQTYSNFELIISDDASTDRTRAKLQQWVNNDSRIKLLIQETNIGFNANFEFALRQAASSLIAISDQDDIWHPQKIERMLTSWKPGMPMIHCDSQRFRGEISDYNPKRKYNRRFEGIDSKKLFFFNSVSGHAMIIQKALLEKILPFEKGIYYDWWTAFVASCNGGVDYLDETLVFQRVHDCNASIDKQENRQQSFLRYREEVRMHIKKFISAPNLNPDDKQVGANFYHDLSSLKNLKEKLHLLQLMLRHRNSIFYHKKRKIGLFSHFKHAMKWAFS